MVDGMQCNVVVGFRKTRIWGVVPVFRDDQLEAVACLVNAIFWF
jgi:hypothetical protein